MYTKYIVTRTVSRGIKKTTTYSSGEWFLLNLVKLIFLIPLWVVVFFFECFIFVCSLVFEIFVLPLKLLIRLIRH